VPVSVLNRIVSARRQLGAYLSMTTAGVWDAILLLRVKVVQQKKLLRGARLCESVGANWVWRCLRQGSGMAEVGGWRMWAVHDSSTARPAPPLAAEMSSMVGKPGYLDVRYLR
jgi:hypothetical protein